MVISMNSVYTRPRNATWSLLLLIPLLAAVILGAFGFSVPVRTAKLLEAANASAPLANPTLTLLGVQHADTASANALSALGSVCRASVLDTKSIDGTRIRLIETDPFQPEQMLVLTEGRMPQNDRECVIVPCADTPLPLCQIGAAVRPCRTDGSILSYPITEDSPAPFVLTVVGIGRNVLSDTASLSQAQTQAYVYTSADLTAVSENTVQMLYLTEYTASTPIKQAVFRVYESSDDARAAELRAHLEAVLSAAKEAAERADDALTDQEILVREAENSIAIAELRIRESEDALITALTTLLAEKQEFVSNMEVNEFYAIRQVDLIPRRDRAEEGYAKQQAVIDGITAELNDAYAERNAVQRTLDERTSVLNQKTAELASANAAYAAASAALEANAPLAAWEIVARGDEPAHAALTASAAGTRRAALIAACVLAAVTLIGLTLVLARQSLMPRNLVPLLPMLALIGVVGAIIGAGILPSVHFSLSFPALAAVAALPVCIASTATITAASAVGCVLLLLLAAQLSAVLPVRQTRSRSANA